MRVVPETRGSDVVIDAPLPDTRAGRDTAREVRDGLLPGLSVEFRGDRATLRRRHAAHQWRAADRRRAGGRSILRGLAC